MSLNARRHFAVSSGLTASSIIADASFRFDFNTGTINDLVSSTNVLTVTRPYEKYHISSSKRYTRTAAGTVVYDHDSSGNNLGVLIEGQYLQRFQGIRYSNRFAGTGGWEAPNVTWGGNQGAGGGGYLKGCTITGGFPGPIDGLESTAGYQASRLMLDTSYGHHYIGKFGLWNISTFQSYTIAIKGFGDTTNHAVRIESAGSGTEGEGAICITLDLQNGQILDFRTAISSGQERLIAYPHIRITQDGWLLVSFQAGNNLLSGGGTSYSQPRIRIVRKVGNSVVYPAEQFFGDGASGVYLFGFMREYNQLLPSSYVHSDGPASPISRPSDGLSWTLPNPINPNLRAVFVEVFGHVDTSSLLTLDDGTASGSTFAGNYIDLQSQASQYRVAMRRNSGTEFLAAAGMAPAVITTGSWTGVYQGPRTGAGLLPTRQRFVVSWNSSTVSALAGGGPGTQQISHDLGGLPTISRLMIAQGNNGHTNVPIARVIGWNRELTGLEQFTLMSAR